jgi:hypothetical protein
MVGLATKEDSTGLREQWRVTSSWSGKGLIHPAVFEKSAELADRKRVLKHFWRKEVQKSAQDCEDVGGTGPGKWRASEGEDLPPPPALSLLECRYVYQ